MDWNLEYSHFVLFNKLQRICNKFIKVIIEVNSTKKRNKTITKDNILNIQQTYSVNICQSDCISIKKELSLIFNNIFQKKISTVITKSNSQTIPVRLKKQ